MKIARVLLLFVFACGGSNTNGGGKDGAPKDGAAPDTASGPDGPCASGF
jgi:hypothetical protein